MTKISVFGGTEKKKKGKRIKITHYMSCDQWNETDSSELGEYQNAMLLAKNHQADDYDLIFMWDNDPLEGTLFKGQWNDGIINK